MSEIEKDISYISDSESDGDDGDDDAIEKHDKKNEEQSFDLYTPAEVSEWRPLVVFVHGGLWVSRDKGEYSGIGKFLSERGFVTAIVNYRLTSETNAIRPPSHVQDLAAALRRLSSAVTLVPRHNGIVLIGHSCGANMAAQLVLEAARFDVADLPIRAVFAASGLYDLPRYVQDFPAWASALHVTWSADQSRWESPQTIPFAPESASPRAIHWLVAHFVADSYVNEAQARGWLDKLRAADSRYVASIAAAFLPGEHFEAFNSLATDNKIATPAAELGDAIVNFLAAI
jgi:acetyl esterase/lipase